MGRDNAAERWMLRCNRSVLAAVLCVMTCFCRHYFGYTNDNVLDGNNILLGVAVVFFTCVAVLSWDISILQPADTYSLGTTLIQYAMIRVGLFLGKWILRSLLKNTTGIAEQQSKLLMNILQEHKDTKYGNDHNFKDMKSVDDYIKKHPLTTHMHYVPYIDQALEGEEQVLTKSPCVGFATSSGTTGKPKLIPWNKKTMTRFLTQIIFPLMQINILIKGSKLNLNRSFLFRYRPKVETAPCGLEIAPFTHHLGKNIEKIPMYTAPQAVFSITSEKAASYIHALFALRERQVGSVTFNFVGQMYIFWQLVIQNIDDLCDDITNGTLKQDLDIDEELYEVLRKDLYPDPKRANEIRKEFNQGTEELAKRLWPNVTYWRCITMKTMSPQMTYLRNTIMKNVVYVTIYYGASEGLFGIDYSSEELNEKFLLGYVMGFFEFIKESDYEDEQPKTYLAHQLDIGSRYELVITNDLGLCRYRSGDIIQVAEYYSECPVITVEYRWGQLLNVRGEKTPECVFFDALMDTCSKLDVTLIEYTATDSAHRNNNTSEDYTSQYILFIELENHIEDSKLSLFDDSLCKRSEIYDNLRSSGKFVQMEVIQVKRGSFIRLRDTMTKNRSASQFKMPRVLTNEQHIQLMINSQINS